MLNFLFLRFPFCAVRRCPNQIRFPYLLPNILGASLALIGLPLVYFFLEETLDVHMRGDRYTQGTADKIEIIRFTLLF